MLKGLALTPPVVGRISIGKIVVKDGRRLPEKDDEFTITTQVQLRDGWMTHPLDETLRKAQGSAPTGRRAREPDKSRGAAKLRAIPVRLLFDDPDLSLRANYSLFDRTTGRPLCVGNGETCKRVTPTGVQPMACPSPEGCEVGTKGGCRPLGRLNVRIGEDDELGSFVFRTTGFNSIRTLAARLRYFQALSGDHLSALPLELRLRGKSTTQSHRAPIYYVDLTVRAGTTLAQALEAARAEVQARQAAGFDQAALDQAAREGFAAGAFEESQEDGAAVVDEFFPDAADPAGESRQTFGQRRGGSSLGKKLQHLVEDEGPATGQDGRDAGHAPSG